MSNKTLIILYCLTGVGGLILATFVNAWYLIPSILCFYIAFLIHGGDK